MYLLIFASIYTAHGMEMKMECVSDKNQDSGAEINRTESPQLPNAGISTVSRDYYKHVDEMPIAIIIHNKKKSDEEKITDFIKKFNALPEQERKQGVLRGTVLNSTKTGLRKKCFIGFSHQQREEIAKKLNLPDMYIK